MRSIVLSVLLCTFCIHQGYSLSIPEPISEANRHHAECLAEQKLDLSVFGASKWSDFDRNDHFGDLATLEESKRNALLGCLLQRRMTGPSIPPVIRQTEDGTYEFADEFPDIKYLRKTCKEYEHDVNKYAGCYYNNNRFQKPSKME